MIEARALLVRAAAGALAAAYAIAPAAGRAETVSFEAPVSGGYEAPIVGANIHFGLVRILGYTDPQRVLGQLDDVGALSFRDYLPWQSFVFPKGRPPILEKSARLMAFLPQTTLKPVLNLGHANSAVPGGEPPLSDAGLKVFQDYIGEAVELTRRFDPIYEIWNEWNLYTGVGAPQPRLQGAGTPDDPRAPEHYLRVSKAAVEKIRSVDPDAHVLVGTVGDDPQWDWAKAIVAGGVMTGADGLSVHLYNQCARNPHDRTASELIDRLEQLQEDLKPLRAGRETPIYVTEFGWPTSNGNCGMPIDLSAYNFAQFVLRAAALPWVKGIWMHELKNISPDPVDRESNYGLFSYDDVPKPAACFMGAASRIVSQARAFEVREPMPDVFVARAALDDRQVAILWTSGPWVEARFTAGEGGAPARTMCADVLPTEMAHGRFGPAPVIVEFPADGSVSVDVEL